VAVVAPRVNDKRVDTVSGQRRRFAGDPATTMAMHIPDPVTSMSTVNNAQESPCGPCLQGTVDGCEGAVPVMCGVCTGWPCSPTLG
jgi:hypothetical protein